MIEKLVRIQETLESKKILTWEDVEKAFYGQDYGRGPITNVDVGVLINSDLGEIITAVEKNSNLKYFPIFLGKDTWDKGEEHFGFNHHSIPMERAAANIQGTKPICAGYLPEYVTLELDPTIANHIERMNRIEFGGATNNPYTHLLFMDAMDINPKPLFVDTFKGIVSLLQHLERQRKPWWFYDPIKENPKGIRFPS